MPVLEEVSDAEDIDNMDMDLAEFDPNLKTPFAPKLEKTIVRSQDSETQNPPLFPPSAKFEDEGDFTGEFSNVKKFSEEEAEQLKKLQLIYPCYFDKNRSHKEGRRVSKELAVENPLAHDIAEACSQLLLTAVYEPEKTHPQDFGNPGRVRVLLKEDGKPTSVLFENKRALFNQIAKKLRANPTTLKSLDSLPKPRDMNGFEAKELPRVQGFKMNTIVPPFSRFTLGHPMTKSIYEERTPEVTPAEQPRTLPKAPKNKYLHVRR